MKRRRTDDAPGEASPRLGRRACAVFVGLVLCSLYLFLELRLPRGFAEFAYVPSLRYWPFAAMRGFTYEQLWRHAARLLLVGPGLVLVSWGVAGLVPWRAPRAETLRRLTLLAGGLAVIASTLLLASVMRGRVLVSDELTYAYQAQLLSEGRLAESRLPPWGWEPFTIWTELGATGKYLLGEPLIQVPGRLLGLPALVHVPLFALTLLLWFEIVRRETGSETVAGWSTILLASSPMLVLTTATGMSHATSLFCMVAAGYGYSLVRHDRAIVGSLVAGVALGFSVWVRPQVAVPFGTVLGLAVAWELLHRRPRRRWLGLGVLALSAGVFAVALALYNRALTGSMTTLPWSLAVPAEHWGFGTPLEAAPEYRHTLLRAIENQITVLVRLNGWLLGWPLSLGLLGVWWKLGRPLRGAGVWLLAASGLVLFDFGYYSPGVSDTGAVYHYELVLPFVLLAGYGVARAVERWPRLATATLAVHLVLGSGWYLVEKSARVLRFLELSDGPIELALERVEPPALVLYETWPSESVSPGWLSTGFTRRDRSDRDPIVYYPRSNAQVQRALRAFYAGRSCWYYRVDPRAMAPQALRCEEAEHLLARPLELPGPHLRFQPTAMAKGLVPEPGRRGP